MKQYTAKSQITINAPAEQVWDALTNPELVKKYLYGTNVASTWQKGAPIIYSGEWEGKSYEDKGEIVDIQVQKMLKTTYFSSLSGKEDKPENYEVVTYDLDENNGKTKLVITQENCKDQASADHTSKNWQQVLKGMKGLLEKTK